MSAPLVEPSACTWCGIAQRGHGRQYADAAGWHAWERPSQEQILARMKARRLQVAVARMGALPVPVGGERTLDVVEEELTGVNLALWEEVQAYARLRLALTSAQRGRRVLRARVAELDALTPAEIQTCRVCGAGYSYGQPCSTCEFRARMAAEVAGRGSSPEVSADRLTAFFAPVQALREDPCHPCGCPKRFDRHADGCTAQAPQRDACQSCGSLPETWCPDCAVCRAGCFDGFVDNSCTHANASWGGA